MSIQLSIKDLINWLEDQYDPTGNLADAAAELERLYKLQQRTLNDEIIAELWYRNGTYHHHFARAIEAWLKGKEYDKR